MTPSEAYVRVLSPTAEDWSSVSTRSEPQGAQLTLREQAIAADATAQIDVSLALFWRELMSGLCTVIDGFFTEDRCYLVLTPTLGKRPIEGRRRDILEAVLCGDGQKNIAIESKLAPSTVALNARLGLQSMGLTCKPSRVHPLLMLAARAARDQNGSLAATLSFFQRGSDQLRVVAAPRPDRRLSRALPPAELAVVRALIEGQCYAEIAEQRGTSTRTIANQITAVFRRMRVSGRSELLERLFFADGPSRSMPVRTACEPLLPQTEPRSRRSA